MVVYNLAFQEIRDRIRVLKGKMMVIFFSDFHNKIYSNYSFRFTNLLCRRKGKRERKKDV